MSLFYDDDDMKKEYVEQVVSRLKQTNGLLYNTTEENFLEKLYVHSEERTTILRDLVSLFSEDYKIDLLKATLLENEIARKLHELQIVTKENKLLFVQGKLIEEEQRVVYEQLFRALHFVFIAEEQEIHPTCCKIPLREKSENVPKQVIKPMNNLLEKYSKRKFNLERATQNLEAADNTLQEVSKLIQQQKLQRLDETLQQKAQELRDEQDGIKDFDLSELTSTVASFNNLTQKRGTLLPQCSEENEAISLKLSSAVGELHPILQFISNAIKEEPSEELEFTRKSDAEKMLKQARELRRNSIVSKCLSNDGCPF